MPFVTFNATRLTDNFYCESIKDFLDEVATGNDLVNLQATVNVNDISSLEDITAYGHELIMEEDGGMVLLLRNQVDPNIRHDGDFPNYTAMYLDATRAANLQNKLEALK